jgi:hypothetical protein
MAPVNKINKRLHELAILEKSLWKAFEKMEVDYSPPTFNLLRSTNIALVLVQQKLLRRIHFYPCYLLLCTISAIGVVIFSPWLLLLYVIFLAATMYTRSKFVNAFAHWKLGTSEFETYAFGIGQPALAVAGVIKLLEIGKGHIDIIAIQSILKIQKSSNELFEVSTGVGEALKKYLFTVPFLIAAWIVNETTAATKYLTLFNELAAKNWTVVLLMLLFILALILASYELVLGQTFLKRKKRKYLLVLTLISESFVQRQNNS